MASSCARQAERPPGRASYLFGARAGVQRGLLIDDPRWREPARDLDTMPTERMGPPARSFAADAHDCIMVRVQTALPHTSVRREDAPMASSPRMIMTQTPELRNEKPIALFMVPPRAQAFKALRNTSDAKAARRQALLA